MQQLWQKKNAAKVSVVRLVTVGEGGGFSGDLNVENSFQVSWKVFWTLMKRMTAVPGIVRSDGSNDLISSLTH